MKVLLAYRCSDEGRHNPFERVLPVGLGYIHAHLRASGISAHIANFSADSHLRVGQFLQLEQPDIVGISCFTFNRRAAIDLARIVRRALPRATIVMGGPHATHAGRSLLETHPEIDICVVGEGELTMERLVDRFAGGGSADGLPGLIMRSGSDVVATEPAPPIEDLDALAFPASYPDGHGVDPLAQYPYIVTSRGCPAACSFCSSPEFWGRTVRFRSAANILDELELLRHRFGILYVSFRDDIFALNKRRVLELCRGIVERRLALLWDCQTRVNTIDEERLIWMKRAGCIAVQYGIESGSQRILDALQKGQRIDQIERAAQMTRKVGLSLSIYLVSGVPGETEADLAATERLVAAIRPHDGIVTPLAVFPGTDLWSAYRKEQGLDERFWEEVGHDGVFVRPDRFTEEAILRMSSLLERAAGSNGYRPADFAAHREVVGECHATDLMEGESREREGDVRAARTIYLRLAEREPWNPWPLLRLGAMTLAAGDRTSASHFALDALRLAPLWRDAADLAASAGRSVPAFARPGRGAARKKPRASVALRPTRAFQSFPPLPRDRGDGAC